MPRPYDNHMQKIGLTGGIGSGKTTVAKLFEMLGVPVFYADLEAHYIRSRTEISEQIIQYFGSSILTENQIDKHKLADVIFNNPHALCWLNALIHPLLKKEFDKWCNDVETKYTSFANNPIPFVIMDAALIFEANFQYLFDKIIVVDAPENLRISRVMKRENICEQEVLQRINSQMSADEKLQKADIVIQNNEHHSLIEQVSNIMSNITKTDKR
jgi:dephospho-CoA kinase